MSREPVRHITNDFILVDFVDHLVPSALIAARLEIENAQATEVAYELFVTFLHADDRITRATEEVEWQRGWDALQEPLAVDLADAMQEVSVETVGTDKIAFGVGNVGIDDYWIAREPVETGSRLRDGFCVRAEGHGVRQACRSTQALDSKAQAHHQGTCLVEDGVRRRGRCGEHYTIEILAEGCAERKAKQSPKGMAKIEQRYLAAGAGCMITKLDKILHYPLETILFCEQATIFAGIGIPMTSEVRYPARAAKWNQRFGKPREALLVVIHAMTDYNCRFCRALRFESETDNFFSITGGECIFHSNALPGLHPRMVNFDIRESLHMQRQFLLAYYRHFSYHDGVFSCKPSERGMISVIILTSRTVRRTRAIGRRIGAGAPSGGILAFRGDLGAGKTTMTKGIAEGLGIEQTIASPTYTLISEYQGRLRLVHMDAYRLFDEDEFAATGGIELLGTPGTLCVVEWSERISGVLPKETQYVSITVEDDGTRLIMLEGSWIEMIPWRPFSIPHEPRHPAEMQEPSQFQASYKEQQP